ncbi:hypothetical protein PF004_g13047 [Phytophthora fragariae]|uniref:RxLR effector protein n=1 Tax=Phytophthora fragariae TaxID=53985 RepID=A0A6G0NTA2_9STRA|nr:hypothetical protein PF004_g13047 [Phytophthora fragariae]
MCTRRMVCVTTLVCFSSRTLAVRAPGVCAVPMPAKGTTTFSSSAYHLISLARKLILTPCVYIQSSPIKKSGVSLSTSNASTCMRC